MISGDTIAAISSATGQAARMVVRVSGPAAIELATQLGVEPGLPGGSARRCELHFCDLSLPSWVYLFRGPRSYTGEDLVEFHLPGSPVLAKMLLDRLLRAGARPAGPGEFTARAYFNGRIDLTAAEGVAATIAAGSEQELAAARQLLSGELARRLAPVMEALADTLALLEVGIDFSEEDVSFLSPDAVRERIGGADDALSRLLSDSARFERLAHEPQVVLVGRPNAGKSTLLNALAGRERAVVSATAGTTRDALSAEVTLARGIIHLIDVAGIEPEAAHAGASEIEARMREHALRAVESADVVVLVEDPTGPRPPLALPREPALHVRNKSDLPAPAPSPHTPAEALTVSALTGAGLDRLRARLDAICFGETSAGTSLALNLRHVHAITQAREALRRVRGELEAGRLELIALELREALDSLGGVLGRLTPDDLLGRIFSGFCIGK